MAERENACSRSHGSVEPRSWNVGWPPFGSGLLPGSDYGRHPSGNGSRRMICRGPGARSAVGASAETAGRGGRNCGFTASAAAAIYERSAAQQHRAFARAAPGGSADPRCAARSPISSQPPLANQVASKMPTSKSARAGCRSDVRIEWPAPSPAGVFRKQFVNSAHAQS
jgi:hypothetical protein